MFGSFFLTILILLITNFSYSNYSRQDDLSSSVVVIPPMQICPGDLLVYSRVLTHKASGYGEEFFTLSRGPAYRLPMPLFYFSVQVIETSILITNEVLLLPGKESRLSLRFFLLQ